MKTNQTFSLNVFPVAYFVVCFDLSVYCAFLVANNSRVVSIDVYSVGKVIYARMLKREITLLRWKKGNAFASHVPNLILLRSIFDLTIHLFPCPFSLFFDLCMNKSVITRIFHYLDHCF